MSNDALCIAPLRGMGRTGKEQEERQNERKEEDGEEQKKKEDEAPLFFSFFLSFLCFSQKQAKALLGTPPVGLHRGRRLVQLQNVGLLFLPFAAGRARSSTAAACSP